MATQAIAQPQRQPQPQPSRVQLAQWAISDTLVMTRRNLLVWIRVPAYIAFTVIQPVIFVLLFRYVFGGAIPVTVQGGYVEFLIPGIAAQTAAFGSFATAIALAEGMRQGLIDRLRSIPMARSAVLGGRLLADSIRMLITILTIVLVGYLVGFRFHNGALGALGMILLAELLGVVVCCVSGYIGLAIKDQEAVQAFGLIWIFPLTFVSSAFVDPRTMPAWLAAFANHQPFTVVVNAMRAMALGGDIGTPLWQSLLWLAGVLVVFVPLAVRTYRRG